MKEQIDEKSLELLQLVDMSRYEAKAYLAIISSKGLLPIDITKISKVPLSRVYSILKKLEQKNYIIKEKIGYVYVPEKLVDIKNETKKIFGDFTNYLDELILEKIIPEEILSDEIISIILQSGYELSFKGRLDDALEIKNIYPSTILEQFHNIKLPWIIISTSKTSGHKMGFILFTSDFKLSEFPDDFFIIHDMLRILKLDRQVILAHKIPTKMKEYFKKSSFLSLSDDFRNQIKSKLEFIDKEWNRNRRNLQNLQKLIDNSNHKINQLNNIISYIRFTLEADSDLQIKSWILSAFDEIIDEINVDIKSHSEFYFHLKLQCFGIQAQLDDDKILPKQSEIDEIEYDVESFLSDLNDIHIELAFLRKEITDVVRTSIYAKAGFHANPFVFTVPIDTSLNIIGRNSTILQLDTFIQNLTKSNSPNLALIIEDSGMGKTHLMKHFIQKINDKSNPSEFGIYLKCNPGLDIFSIFNEIRISLEKMPSSSIVSSLLAILNEFDFPLTVNELASVLRTLSQFSDKMNKTLVFFLDEFENLFSIDYDSEKIVKQLQYVIGTSKINTVVALRKLDWDVDLKLQEILNESKSTSIKLEKLESDSIKIILNRRLEELSTSSKPSISFTNDAIEKISQASNGNIRSAIILARSGFRKAVLSKQRKISSDILTIEKQKIPNIPHYPNSVNELNNTKGGEKIKDE